MVNMSKKFEQQRQESEQKIKALLWEDTDNDSEIIELANKSGIKPEQVETWAGEVESARELKQQVADIDIAALQADAKKCSTQAKATHTKLKKAEDAYNTASQKSQTADRELKDAKMAVESLTRELYRINSPQDQIPPECRAIHKAHRMAENRDEQRSILRRHGKKVKELEEELELLVQQLDGVDTQTEHGEMVLRGPDLVPRGQATEQQREAVERRLSEAQKNADDATKVLQGLEQKVSDARREASM